MIRRACLSLVLLFALATSARAQLLVDASTPAISSADTTNTTTAAFTPPNGALLVALVGSNSDGGAVVITMATVTGSTSVWTKRKQIDPVENSGLGGCAAVYTATVTSSISTTVRATKNGANNGVGLQVVVLTGFNTSTPIGNTGAGTSTTLHITPTVLTTSANGSWVMGAFNDFDGSGTITTADTGTGWQADGDDDGVNPRKSAATASSMTAVTLDANRSAGTASWNWAAVEVMAAAAGATCPLTRNTLGVGC